MSRFEYYLAFETILYGLVLAHAVIGFSQMIHYRKTIKFYWGHTLACITIFFVVVQTYYSLFWVPPETVINAWTFFFLRIFPLTILYIATFQLFPKKMKNLDAESYLYGHLKELLLPMVVYNLASAAKSIYYRWDEYLALGNGNIMNSDKFIFHLTPPLVLSGLAMLMIFYFQRKRLIEAFILFTFFAAMGYMTFGVTE